MGRILSFGSAAALLGCGALGLALGWSSLSTLRTGKVSACGENLKSLGAAVLLYSADSDGRMPYYPRTSQGITSRPAGFFTTLTNYGATSNQIWCPLDKHAGTQFAGFLHDFMDTSYAIGPSLGFDADLLPDGVGVALASIEEPSDIALLADNQWIVKIGVESEWMTAHGKNRGNVLWADGRIEPDFEYYD